MKDSTLDTSRRADTAAVVFTLVFPTLVTLVYFVLLADHSANVQQVTYGIGKGIQFLFPVFWVLAVQRHRLQWKWPDTKGLREGVGFGVLVLVAMLLLFHLWLNPSGYLAAAGEAVRQKVVGFGAGSRPRYIALGVSYALGHSFLEEYYWRWFVFGQLRRLVPLWGAILISSLGFMAHHVLVLATFFGWFSIATVLFSLAVAVGGAVWAGIYHRSDSLWGPWISHLCVDAGIFTIGYYLVADLLTR